MPRGTEVGSASYNSGNNTYYANKYEAIPDRCSHEHSTTTCYDLICTKPIHPEHTEAEGCYSDVIHTQHTDSCYGHVSHSHTEDCYEYLCGEDPHDHVDACYRACTKYEHTHGNSCQYGTGSNTRDYEIFRVITAKYEAYIGDQWPTADDIDGFAYWSSTVSSLQSSKVVTLTSNYCVDGLKLLAYTGNTKYTLNYWFEHYDDTVVPDNITYKEYNGVTYKLSTEYSQTVFYNSGQGTWSYKSITGMTGTRSQATVEDGNIFNLYYTRNRYDLEFYNVSSVVKKQENIMFEQPLAGIRDSNNALLSDFVPEFPTDSYEAGSRVFDGWYTTPECMAGTKVDFSQFTMPNSDLTFYAKWEPISHAINYYLSKDSMERGETIPEEMERLVDAAVAAGAVRPTTDPYTTTFQEVFVKHGAYIQSPSDPEVAEGYEEIHPNVGYEFIGWFYLDDEGKEAAFDPVNMTVIQDLNLYAKWSSNVLCYYNIYFALDSNKNGVFDEGEPHVAERITGSGIGGKTYTFIAKGGEDLYKDYRGGYFPNVDSHSISIVITDPDGTGDNSYTFLYQERAAVPYTVKYVDTATGNSVEVDGNPVPDKFVSDNKNVIVTEDFVPVLGYMPDAYQKTLVVTADGTNVITFYYTKDEVHALYVTNYYVEELNEDLSHKGWIRYSSLQNTDVIGKMCTADAIDINGFTLSKTHTSGLTADNKLSGELTAEGLKLDFYYTRNLYPYEFRYILKDTATELAEPEFGKAGFGMVVTEPAKEIKIDLDGDGINEEFRLYNPAENTKTITLAVDGEALNSDATVTAGQAKINVATFDYVRCTQTMTITKQGDTPGSDYDFRFQLKIHAKDGYHQTSYSYTKTYDGGSVSGTLSPLYSDNSVMEFTLKVGETIKIEGLPTAKYTVTEVNLPDGYVNSNADANKERSLTVNGQLNITVTNALNSYTVTWKNYDGTVLETDTGVSYGATPSYDGEIPVKPGDAQYTYTFAGWDPEIATVTGDATYTATYNSTVNEYTITWIVDGITTTETYEYGATPSFKGSTDKAPTAQYKYTFAGWTPEIASVTGYATYTATYTEKLYAADFIITRTNADSKQVFVYRVTGGTLGEGKYIEVTIQGPGSVTIADLPFGKYTVTQMNDWSWRYEDGAQTVTHSSEETKVEFVGGITNNQWLSSILVTEGDLKNFWKNKFGGT